MVPYTVVPKPSADSRPSAMAEAISIALAHRSMALLVHAHGETVLNAYWKEWNASTRRSIASVSKSMVSVLVGICIHRGAIRSIDQPVADFVTEWRGTEKAVISIRHLLTMTSGLHNPPLWLLLLERSPALTLGLELVQPPGSHWAYNTAAYCVLMTVIERASGQRLEDFTQAALFGPLGMERAQWHAWTVGRAHPLSVMCAGPDLMNFGRLLLQRGSWNGQLLLDPGYIDRMLAPVTSLNKSYGHLIWLNRGEPQLAPGAPSDAAMAMGASDSRLYVIPSRELVIVRLGGWVQAPRDRFPRKLQRSGSFDDLLLRAVCAATTTAAAQQAAGPVTAA